jgi:hypothetical protein
MTMNQRNFIIGVAAIVMLVGAFFFIGALGQEHTRFRPVHTTFRPGADRSLVARSALRDRHSDGHGLSGAQAGTTKCRKTAQHHPNPQAAITPS